MGGGGERKAPETHDKLTRAFVFDMIILLSYCVFFFSSSSPSGS